MTTATKPATEQPPVERPTDPEWAHKTLRTLLDCVGVYGRAVNREAESDGHFVPLSRGKLQFVGNDRREQNKDSAAYANEGIAWLLDRLGYRGKCKACNAPVVFVRHVATGKYVPYNMTGLNHFATCPAADRFRKPASKPAAGEVEPQGDQF